MQTELTAVRLINIYFTGTRDKAYGKLLSFIDNTTRFRVDRLLGMLPGDGTQFKIYTDRRELTICAHRLV
jgi:hypothetical protein